MATTIAALHLAERSLTSLSPQAILDKTLALPASFFSVVGAPARFVGSAGAGVKTPFFFPLRHG